MPATIAGVLILGSGGGVGSRLASSYFRVRRSALATDALAARACHVHARGESAFSMH
jgi:hypothetical protein